MNSKDFIQALRKVIREEVQNAVRTELSKITPLTEERRRDLVKQAKAEAEDAKIGVRNARQEANKDIKGTDLPEDTAKDAEASIQELTNQYSKKIEELLTVKEAEIMKV